MLTAGLQGATFGKTRCPRAALGSPMETTGRSLVLDAGMASEGMHAAVRTLQDGARLSAVRTSRLAGGTSHSRNARVERCCSIHRCRGRQRRSRSDRPAPACRPCDPTRFWPSSPERVVYPASSPTRQYLPGSACRPASSVRGARFGALDETVNRDYLRGFRDGFHHATGLCLDGRGTACRTIAVQRPSAALTNRRSPGPGKATRGPESNWTPAGVSRCRARHRL